MCHGQGFGSTQGPRTSDLQTALVMILASLKIQESKLSGAAKANRKIVTFAQGLSLNVRGSTHSDHFLPSLIDNFSYFGLSSVLLFIKSLLDNVDCHDHLSIGRNRCEDFPVGLHVDDPPRFGMFERQWLVRIITPEQMTGDATED